MPTTKELQEQIDQMMTIIEKLGGRRFLPQQQREQGPPPNFIGHGSKEHVQFLGLIEVDEKDAKTVAEVDKYVVYRSRKTGRYFRLQDEFAMLRNYPGIDPEKAALVVLRQKIGSLESGKPQAPANAPTRWDPGAVAVR